jgi:hypothetical protein
MAFFVYIEYQNVTRIHIEEIIVQVVSLMTIILDKCLSIFEPNSIIYIADVHSNTLMFSEN